MLIAHLTDPHTKTAGTRLFGGVDTYGGLERAVAHVNAMAPRADIVLLTGDVTNDGNDDDYAQAAALLDRLEMPMYLIPGNHDDRAARRRHFPNADWMPKSGSIHYTVDDHAVRLIGLDTLVEGAAHGQIGTGQLAWLDRMLGQQRRPTLIFMHHPPFSTGLAGMDGIGLVDAAAFADIVSAHSHVELIACGHVHRTIIARFAGTVGVVAPATAHQVALNLNPKAANTLWIMEPPGVMVHRWANGHMVSHVSPIGDFGPASPFHDHHSHIGGSE